MAFYLTSIDCLARMAKTDEDCNQSTYSSSGRSSECSDLERPSSVWSDDSSAPSSPPLTPIDVVSISESISANVERRQLYFSIDNILSDSFGTPVRRSTPIYTSKRCEKFSAKSSEREIELPVDLSRTSNQAPKQDPDCPAGMVRGPNGQLLPAWVFCTRYSDRPSSGPRVRKAGGGKRRQRAPSSDEDDGCSPADKRARTAFSKEQLERLKKEFEANRYLTEERRVNLTRELGLTEGQLKIWFQNKRAKLKKAHGERGELAKILEKQGLYNHQTCRMDEL